MIFIGSAVSGAIYHIDSAIAQLDGTADKDAIMKLTFIKYILDNDLFGRRKKRWEQSKINYFHNQVVK